MTGFDAVVVGAGPAGLMAAEQIADAGFSVGVFDAMPSVGRKFLMAGKSGLNLTKDEPFEAFKSNVMGASQVSASLDNFTNADVVAWAQELGQDVFTGSSGRVFPKVMKASPLLRAWIARLTAKGVKIILRHKLASLAENTAEFVTPDGNVSVCFRTAVLALGGASWARLGSTGQWTDMLAGLGVKNTAFLSSNMGFNVAWSDHMTPHFGSPVKPVSLTTGEHSVLGEFVISKSGIEGSAVYAVSAALRNAKSVSIDLLPDWDDERIKQALKKPKGKASLSTHLRKRLNLSKVKIALLNECARPFPENLEDVPFKNLSLALTGARPLDEAISTAGGVSLDSLTDDLKIKNHPLFCAGEMLDWDAPTGGYLITTCLATGRHAGKAAAQLLSA